MEGWVGGWMDGWMDGWDGWMDGWTDGWRDRQTGLMGVGVGLITTGYCLLPPDAAVYLYRYV